MGYPNELYNAAMAEIQSRHDRAARAAQERRDAYCVMRPEYAVLERELLGTGRLLVRTIFNNDEQLPDINALRDRNLATQKRMEEMLAEDGLAPDDLEPKYTCADCGDTGVFNGRVCHCVTQIIRQTAYERLNAMTPLDNCTFDSFSLDYYPDTSENPRLPSPRRVMQKTFETCRDYAANFSMSSPSLLLQGGVGLGKTHLSLAIAGAVIDRGFDVVYGSAHTFFGRIEREKFGRSTADDDTLGLLCACDLLILDDLGVEFVSTFTVSTLYDIVNSRLLASRPTIINTNLTVDGLEQKYSERLVSRFLGSYTRIPFVGNDIRALQRRAGGQRSGSGC